jgi:hypothetical protein
MLTKEETKEMLAEELKRSLPADLISYNNRILNILCTWQQKICSNIYKYDSNYGV